MPIEGRKLILEAAGGFRPGERVNQLLYRVHDDTGLGLPSLQKLWKDQYGSKNTVSTLQQTKAERAKNNADNLASTIETLETLAAAAELAGDSGQDVEILRAAAHTLRNRPVSAGPETDREK